MFRDSELFRGENMESVYKNISLQLILGISKALEQMEAQSYAAAEEILRRVWQEAAGGEAESWILR